MTQRRQRPAAGPATAFADGPDSRRSSPPPASPGLIGRGQEIARLGGLIAAPPALVLVRGEAGVGKTRLVREAVSAPVMQPGPRVLTGHCHPVREPFPFGPVIEALRLAVDWPCLDELSPVTGSLADLIPELSAALPPAPPPLRDPGADRHRQLRALRDVVAALGAVVLVLEDLHWADDTTQDLLTFLAPQLPPQLVLIGTYRDEELPAASSLRSICSRVIPPVAGETLSLEPLGIAGVSALAAGILGTAEISDAFAAQLHARTGGLPFAVEEVLRLLRDREPGGVRAAARTPQDLEDAAVPEGIAGSIHERLQRLPAPARRLVQAAAVLGVPASERLLGKVADVPGPGIAAAAAAAVASGLLVEVDRDTVGFRHLLARDAVHEATAGPERRELHLRAARAIARTRPKPLARLAHHYREAQHPRLWARYAEAAADQAVSRGHDHEAFRLLRDPVAAPSISGTTRTRLAIKLGRAAYHGSAYDEGIASLRDILAQEPRAGVARGELRLRLGLLLDRVQEDEASYEMIASAVEDLESDPALQARAMAALVVPTYGEPHVSEHLRWSFRALQKLGEVDDPVFQMAVQTNHAAILVMTGDASGWQVADDIPRGGTEAERREKLRCCWNLAAAATEVGHYARAAPVARRAGNPL